MKEAEEEEEEEGRIMQKKHELPLPITKSDIVLRYVIKGKKNAGKCPGTPGRYTHREREEKEREHERSAGRFTSHEIVIIQIIPSIVIELGEILGRPGDQRDLGLGRLGLLVALLRLTLLLQLLVADGRQGAGDLLDVGAVQVLDQLLRKVHHPDRVLRLLGLRRQQRDEGVGEARELLLGRGLKERHRGEVDGVGRVGRVVDHDGLGAAVTVQVDVLKQVLGVLEVRVLLRGAQPGAPCGLVLLLALLLLLLGEPSPPVGFLVLLYPLRLGLLLRRGLGLRLGFSRGGLRGLFPLYLGVLSGVP